MREFRPVSTISRSILVVYFIIISMGTILLLLPFSGNRISFIDALYTSTSATCVTGLIIRDTAKDFTLFGKIVIAFLIQIGGIGYMSFSALLLGLFRGRLSFFDRLAIQESYKTLNLKNIGNFIVKVIIFTGIMESIGAVILLLGFLRKGFPFPHALGHAIFHSISAFCNAGFSTFSNNLGDFKTDIIIPLTVALLLFTGGLGFPVLVEITSKRKYTSIHTKFVLITSSVLFLLGVIVFLPVEWDNTLKGIPLLNKIMVSVFHSLTPRTAGFSLLDISLLKRATIFITMILMFIGASPGGTGGGIKTTTLSVLLIKVKSVLKDEPPSIFGRRISQASVDAAHSIFFFSIFWVLTSFFFILLYENMDILRAAFEVVSAFGTVGLSMGSRSMANVSASYDFSMVGKLIIIITMFVGRVGILTLLSSLMGRERVVIKYPEEKVMVG